MRFARHMRHGKASEAVILFEVAGYKFAISASAVEEIRGLEGLQQTAQSFAPRALMKVRHMFERVQERKKKTYYVVDSNLHFRLLPSRASRILLLRDQPVALLVDNIDRMAEIQGLQPLPHSYTGEERHWYRGVALIGEDVIPVVDSGCVLSKGEIAMLKATVTSAPAPEAIAGAVTA